MKIVLAVLLLVLFFYEEFEGRFKRMDLKRREDNKKKELINFWIEERENL